MKAAYRYLAWLIALDVLLQAASIAYGSFAMATWVGDGHTLTKSALEAGHYTGAGGFAFHGFNGMIVMGVLGIAFLVVALVCEVPGASRVGGILFAMIVVQIGLGSASHAVPALGMVHGILALAVFGYAAMAGVRAMLADRRAAAPAPGAPA